jgi:hypothetical protein
MTTRRLSAVPAVLLMSWARVAAAQVAAGPEFRVNTYTTGAQESYRQFLAVAPNGDFVVTWEDVGGHDGDRSGVFAQRFNAAGAPLGGEFRVNTYTTSIQTGGAVAMDGRGRFVIVWASDRGDGGDFDVLAQRYDAGGAPMGGEFRVNEFTAAEQYNPTVAADATGDFVVVWSDSSGRDGDARGPFGRRFDASGAAIGSDSQINTYTTGAQWAPAVGCHPSGAFVVTWGSSGQDGSGEGVFAQRFDAAGQRLGGELAVNTYTTGVQTASRVAINAAGEFVIAWFGPGPGDDNGAFLRRYDAAGSALGAEFRVNTNTILSQARPAVGYDAAGSPVVTWYDTFADGAFDTGILAQRFTPDWTRRGAEFHVNTYTPGTQHTPALAVDGAGNFQIAWTSQNQDGSGDGLFAQRYGGLFPSALSVDTTAAGGGNGNRVLEPGETVDVAPSWRNLNGTPQPFAGALSNIAGPPGPSYAIADGAADYGSAPDGAVQPCADCYAVSVSSPTVRPAVHWDVTVDERITPDAQGQYKRWALHVGRSFDDVAAASPFYRFVETLLHHGVTGGCSGGQYCPASATTREQMAVFVLIAREGAGYAPPACATPVFGDVPASSPFCRFIEELARRAVVSGCGGGNYCPSAAVTREQMAVFVLRALDPALTPPACATPVFADVPASSPFCRWIEELARRGVVTGCGNGNYCPSAAVTREQMGVFLSATFALALYGV